MSGRKLSDSSWIKKPDDEDEDVDRDPNFAKLVLRGYRPDEILESDSSDVTRTTKTTKTSSVLALTKRFSPSQEKLNSTPNTSYTRSSYSSVDPDSPGSTKTTTITKDGTTETITTTTQSIRSPVLKTPTKTETFTERVKSSSSKSPLYSTYSPTRTTKVTEKTVTSPKIAEDKLYDTLIPSAIKNDDYSPTDSKTTVTSTETVIVKSSGGLNAEDKLYDTLIPRAIKNDITDSTSTVSSTETVTIKSSTDGDGYKTTTTTRTSSSADDDLYDSLRFRSSTSDVSSPIRSSITKREVITVESSRDNESPTVTSPSSTRTTSYSSYDDLPSSRSTSYTISSKPSTYSDEYSSYSYTKPDSSYEYTSITSPTVYSSSSTSYRSSSRSDDVGDPLYSKSSIKSAYTTPERTVLEKDLCTYCHKPFTGDAKMVLDDMKINCHATCFKCDVCKNSLGNLKAGDSMWIYKRMVHCENCFDGIREKWRR